jgi:hypothetical protein
LIDVARKYQARYLLLGHRLEDRYDEAQVDLGGNGSWFLYDLSKIPNRAFAGITEAVGRRPAVSNTSFDVERWLLEQHGIRAEPQMQKYVLKRLQQAGSSLATPFHVMGGNARTGAAVRMLIDPASLPASQINP